jgi:hypothetical protein
MRTSMAAVANRGSGIVLSFPPWKPMLHSDSIVFRRASFGAWPMKVAVPGVHNSIVNDSRAAFMERHQGERAGTRGDRRHLYCPRYTPNRYAASEANEGSSQKNSRSTKGEVSRTVVQRPVDTSSTSIERRSPVRQRSRGDKRRMSPSVIVHIVQAYDFVLLLLSGLRAESMLTRLYSLRFAGSTSMDHSS